MNFKLSPEQVQLLCYQRSQYCEIISSAWQKEMEETFQNIKSYLPQSVSSILDVGAGMAGIDVMLANKYPKAKITLLDKNGFDQRKRLWGWNTTADSFGEYCNFEQTQKILTQNNIKAQFVDVGKERFPEQKFDLIISFLSWGFHYPVSTYANLIKSPCTIILDVRKGHDDKSLGEEKIIFSAEKYERKVFYI